MLTKRAKEIVDHAKPHEEIAFILSVVKKPPREIEHLRDRWERRKLVDEFYRELKAPVFLHLRKQEKAGLRVRVVDLLDGTPQMILAGPAQAWRDVFHQQSNVLSWPEFLLTANEPEITLP